MRARLTVLLSLIGLVIGGFLARRKVATVLGLPAPTGEDEQTDEQADMGPLPSTATTHELSLSRRTGLTVATLRAIAKVESGGGSRAHTTGSGRGAGSPGKPKVIRFEPHLFLYNTRAAGNHANRAAARRSSPHFDKIPYTPSGRAGYEANSFVPSETGWQALMTAFALSRTEAIRATSWGRYQVMGGWFKNTLASNPVAFIQRWVTSDLNEIEVLSDEMLVEWIAGNPVALAAAKAKDWLAFAVAYNGTGAYAPRFIEAYAEAVASGAPTSMIA